MSEDYFDRSDREVESDRQPQGQFPQGQFPQGQFPQGQFPQGQFPQGQFPQGQFPQDQYPQEQYQQDQYGQPYLAPYRPGQHFFGQYAPNMRPPNYMPRRPARFPGPIRFCVNSFAYIWFRDGRNYWAWISFVARRTIYGYRWNGRRWIYFQANVNDIDTFLCIR